jgi:hypothetical protein
MKSIILTLSLPLSLICNLWNCITRKLSRLSLTGNITTNIRRPIKSSTCQQKIMMAVIVYGRPQNIFVIFCIPYYHEIIFHVPNYS